MILSAVFAALLTSAALADAPPPFDEEIPELIGASILVELRTEAAAGDPALAAFQAALLEGLEDVLPGIEVVDRDIVFEGGARADLAAVDPSGRLVLVLLVTRDEEKAILGILDHGGVQKVFDGPIEFVPDRGCVAHEGRSPNSGRSVRVRLSSQKPSMPIIATMASQSVRLSSVLGTRVMTGPKMP